MKIEPSVLQHAHALTSPSVLSWVVLLLAIVISIAAVRVSRRGPSVSLGLLCSAAIMAIVVAAVLTISTTRAHAGEVCTASQYGVGDGYHGRRTASGRTFDTYATSPYTIARPSRSDLGRRFRITNLKNGRSIEALSTDLGPFIASRCVDLGRAGADALGMGGLAFVRVERID